jgi:ABC-type multidrug transport system permease subunit
LWLPRALMPGVLQGISNYTPLGAAVGAIQDSMLQGFPPAAPLLVLAAYALVFGFLARASSDGSSAQQHQRRPVASVVADRSGGSRSAR